MGDSELPSTQGDDIQKNVASTAEGGRGPNSEAGTEQRPLREADNGSASGTESEPPNKLTNQPGAVVEKGNSVDLTLRQRIDKRREQLGLPPIPRVPDRSGELEEGDVMLYSGITRHVIRRANNTAVKYGSDLIRCEVATLQFAKDAGIPVPEVYGFGKRSRDTYIEMEFIEGDTLESAWASLSHETRVDMARQLGRLLKIMRALPPPPNFIGGFALDELRDFRHNDVFVRPACRNQEEFNAYLTEEDQIPAGVKRAFLRGIGTGHKIVFSHCDLAPRNIIVRDNRIVALIDWEAAGWYPEYWECVKFMHVAGRDREWRTLVDEIFSEPYDTEILLYTGLLHYQDYFDSRRRAVLDAKATTVKPCTEVEEDGEKEGEREDKKPERDNKGSEDAQEEATIAN